MYGNTPVQIYPASSDSNIVSTYMDGEVNYVILSKTYKIVYNAPFQIKCAFWMHAYLDMPDQVFAIVPGYEFIIASYTQIKIENNIVYARYVNTTSGGAFYGLLVMMG